MKIGSAPGGLDPSLIERIHGAHTDSIASASAHSSSKVDRSSSSTPTGAPAPPPTGLKLDALRIVEAVVTGVISTGDEARERILGAIVDSRFGAAISRPERKRCMEMLRVTLMHDPTFEAEIDEMLVLAAGELHTLPSE